MQKKAVVLAIAFFAIVALALLFSSGGNQAPLSGGHSNLSSSGRVLFASSQYAPYSYLVSSPTISPQAQAALAGYNLSRSVLQNGTVKMRISIPGTSANQTLMLAPTDKLYVVETSFGDDGYGYEGSYGDDGFIVVNQTGYLV